MRITDQINMIARDLTFNHTKMYEREDIVIAFLLTYFSPLELRFDNRNIRGWLDILLMGESRSGKSATARTLQSFFKKGGLTREKVTYAGLVGGVDRNQHGNMAKTGVFSSNDRGAVIIDEMQNLSIEELGKMSDVRSSGVAHIVAICTIINMARCRKIWIANPRTFGEQQHTLTLTSNGAPVNLVRSLVGALEDMTRFDLMLAYKMTPESIWDKYRNAPKPKEIFTAKKFQRALEIAWTRGRDDVIFHPETVEACYKCSNYLTNKYKSDFPMLVGAEQPDRMARLSAACASLVRSSSGPLTKESIMRVEVFPEHVLWVQQWLEHLFHNNDLQYATYAAGYGATSKLQQKSREKIVDKIKRIPGYEQLLFIFRSTTHISPRQLQREAPKVDNIDTVLSGFCRAGLLRSSKDTYYKTDFLNDILNNELASNGLHEDIDNISFGEEVNI